MLRMTVDTAKAKREWAMDHGAPRFWKIVEQVCAETGIERRDLLGPTRGKAPVAAARDQVASRAFHAGFRIHVIAELLGRDWSSVLAMLRRADRAGPAIDMRAGCGDDRRGPSP